MGKTDVVLVTEEVEREAAFAVRKAVFVDEQEVSLALEFDGLDDRAEHLLAVLDGRAVGTLRLRRVDHAIVKIERVAVLREARGHAVGCALMTAALARLRKRGFGQVKLHAQTKALDFYAKLGFAAYGEVFDEDGIAHRAMRIDLGENLEMTSGGGS
ncbi:MAG: GNAT family N-acetyltransferase [Alphaproteobacteria bacterium]|nr:GNAT family N-acetyltransferase [Alphaproteobacteria bacterium]